MESEERMVYRTGKRMRNTTMCQNRAVRGEWSAIVSSPYLLAHRPCEDDKSIKKQTYSFVKLGGEGGVEHLVPPQDIDVVAGGWDIGYEWMGKEEGMVYRTGKRM